MAFDAEHATLPPSGADRAWRVERFWRQIHASAPSFPQIRDVFDPSFASLRDEHGNTPLIAAAREGRKEILLFLLPHSDPNAQNKSGRTALMAAIARRRLDLLPILAPVSDLSLRDAEGFPALGFLFDQFKLGEHLPADAVRPLVEAGADPLLRHHQSWMTPFERAVHLRNWAVVDLFLCAIEPFEARHEADKLGDERFPLYRAHRDAEILQGVADQAQAAASTHASGQVAGAAPVDAALGDSALTRPPRRV
jgi:hypothetical protein